MPTADEIRLAELMAALSIACSNGGTAKASRPS